MAKSLPRFGLDLDGCVYEFTVGATTALHLHRNSDVEIRVSDSWDDIRDRVPRSDWHWLWSEGCRLAFEFSPYYPDVMDGLRVMQEFMDIVVITHRPRKVIDITLRKLAEAGLRPQQVHHVQGESKVEIAQQCVGVVDDKVENVEAYAAALDVPVWMPRRPWNAGYHWPDQEGPADIRPYDDFRDVTLWAHRNFS